ncbi:MAG: hypothetical protein HZA69_04570, partial [Gammaproteobacteria bacterium]|nr:hypothetical protein [Gammaproteobacteria bacterium]
MKTLLTALLAALALGALPALAASDTKHGKVIEAIGNFKKKDPGIKTFFDKAYGYAVFPTVGKGG